VADGGGASGSLMGPRRILVLAPHPDDEIVACGIAAARARAAGARVFVLYLTTGIPARAALWPWQRPGYAKRLRRRREEAWVVASLIGFEPVGFSDFPSRRLRHHLDEAAVEIDRAIAACGAEALWVPAFEGGHQDHDAANALAAWFSARLPVHEFAAYNFAGGQVCANRFADERGGQHVSEASAGEAALKRRALAGYASERGNLRHIGVTHEASRPLPAHDYGAPPHRGRLFRERFHWVPFRHPRIDFDASAAVYADIGRWVSAAPAHRHPALGDRPGQQPGQADREFAGALDETEGERGVGRQSGDAGERDQSRLLSAPTARDQEGGAARGEAQAFQQDRFGNPG
jgi:LmbE family N-acetylglucosaminyl deacetylase